MPLWHDVNEEQAAALQKLLNLRGSSPYHNNHLCGDISKHGTCTSAGRLSRFGLALGYLGVIWFSERPWNGNWSVMVVLATTAYPLIAIWRTFAGLIHSIPQKGDGCDTNSLPLSHDLPPNFGSASGDLASSTVELHPNSSRADHNVPGSYGSGSGDINLGLFVGAYSVNIPEDKKCWILLGVRGHFECFEIDHLDTCPGRIKDDNELFRSLRASHTRLKRLFRSFFSVWQLSHFDFIKASNHDILSHREKLTSKVFQAGSASNFPRHQRTRFTLPRIPSGLRLRCPGLSPDDTRVPSRPESM